MIMISIIIKNIKTAQQAAQLIQTNTTFYFWHKHLTINIRTQLCTLSFKWKQANKLRLILVRTVWGLIMTHWRESLIIETCTATACLYASLRLSVCSIIPAVKSLLSSPIFVYVDLYPVNSQHNPGKHYVPVSIIQRIIGR